jgi:hypothetical protein
MDILGRVMRHRQDSVGNRKRSTHVDGSKRDHRFNSEDISGDGRGRRMESASDGKNVRQFCQRPHEDEEEKLETDWIIIMRAEEADADRQAYIEVIKQGASRSARGIVM